MGRTDVRRRVALLGAADIQLVLDVGAASGEYATELRRSGCTGEIIAFEPLAHLFESLQRRGSRDDRWLAMRSAVGSENALVDMYVAANGNSSSILPMLDLHSQVAPHARDVGREEVVVSRLDGAPDIIRRARGVQLELSLVPLYESGMLFDEAVARMIDEGFELAQIEPGLRDPTTQRLLQADGIFLRPADALAGCPAS